jgi:hypothetical protein
LCSNDFTYTPGNILGPQQGSHYPARGSALALNAAIWHNWAIGAPVKRSLIAYDH